jgi:DNA-binding transcriptional LysR family regulator
MRLTQLRQADLNLLVVFAVLAEERNVSRAASRLLLSQPAVSRALSRLRDLFHDDLMVRTALTYELTPQGTRLLQELEVIFPRLDRLISGGDFDPSLEVASFRIAVTDYAASVFAPLVCRTILPAAKGVSFEFATWRSDRFDRLSHGSLDLVLDADAVRVPSPLQKTELHEEEFVCVVDAEHIRGNRLSLKQYLDGDHVGVSTLEGKQTLPDDRLASVGHQRNVVVKVPYFVAAIEAVAGTKLIATVPRRFALLCAKDKRLGLLSPPNIFQPFKYVMIWHPRVNTDAAHIWLRRTVQNLGKLLDAEKKAK